MTKRLYKTKPPEDDRQFIAIWEYNGELWSDTFRNAATGLEVYSEYWESCGFRKWRPESWSKHPAFGNNVIFVYNEE